jgi:mono/diheme cytochrome c family protein
LALAAFLSTTVVVPRLAAYAGLAERVPPVQDAANLTSASNDDHTKNQGDRGKAAYAKSCSTCHKSDLAGDQSAPALVGNAFVTRWMGQSVGDLFDSIRTGMPMDNPGSLSDNTFVDIVAYILQQNDFPVAIGELKADGDALKKLMIPRK